MRDIHLSFLIVIFFCGLFSTSATADDSSRLDINAHQVRVMTLDKDLLSQDVGLYFDYVEDSEGWLKIDSILEQPDLVWLENKKQTPNFGYSSSTYWFRLSLQNILPDTEERFFVIDYPLLDQIEFYRVKSGAVVERHLTGDSVPFSQRPLAHRSFVFPIIPPVPYTPIGSATFIATQCGDGQNIDGTSENTRYIWHYINEYPAL